MPKRNSLCMKTCRVLLCFTILSLILSGTIYAETSDAEKLNAAVLDFTYKNVSKEDAAIISDFFRSELIKTNKFNVLDRSNIEKILKDWTCAFLNG